jgi:hypothetical protein
MYEVAGAEPEYIEGPTPQTPTQPTTQKPCQICPQGKDGAKVKR